MNIKRKSYFKEILKTIKTTYEDNKTRFRCHHCGSIKNIYQVANTIGMYFICDKCNKKYGYTIIKF
jgi:transcription elongation factor Elf1